MTEVQLIEHSNKETVVLDTLRELEQLGYAVPGLNVSENGDGVAGATQILVVEDEGIVAVDIQDNLESMGYVVPAVIATGEGAIEKAAEIRPDLVLMDIRLKGKVDGVEAARQIRDRFDIPVVYLTAHADKATLQRAMQTEPFGYLLKPFEERELAITIEMALYKHRMEKRLRDSERWLSTTLRSIGDGVIATDDQGYITFMNPVAEALTGWRLEQASGESFGRVFRIAHSETGFPIEDPVMRALRESRVIELGDKVLLTTKQGTQVPIDDSAAPIRDDRGCVTGAVVVFRDISERVKAREELREYASELQERNEDLDAFAHTVAHDLKSPLNPLIGFAEFLKNEHSGLSREQMEEYLGVIAQTGHKMANIVEELLLLAQIRKREADPKPLDMASIVGEAQQRLSHMIEESGAEILVPDTWPTVLGHGPWIEEVWANYLSNGIKYGGDPPRLQLGATPGPGDSITFWIRDHGPGLTPEEQAQLFEPFTQLSRVRATGHGLGLSIVRRIVEKLGGQVGVKSEVGRGSIFFFSLPRATE